MNRVWRKRQAAAQGGDTVTYLKGGGGIVGFEWSSDGAMFYFITDALSTVRDVVNSSGSVVASYEFDEYGRRISPANTGGVESQKTFVGGMSVQDEVADTGLMMMGHRFYAPELGRFLNRDPIGFDGGLNLFEYANSSPSNAIDPRGTVAILPILGALAVGGAIGAIFGAALAWGMGGSAEDIKAAALQGALGGVFTTAALLAFGPTIAAWAGNEIAGGILSGAFGSAFGELSRQCENIAVDSEKTLMDINDSLILSSALLGGIFGSGILRPGLSEADQTVTSWAGKGHTPDLDPGRWVMTGMNNLRNYLLAGLPGKAPYGNSTTGIVSGSNLGYPSGGEYIKGLMGQRMVLPGKI